MVTKILITAVLVLVSWQTFVSLRLQTGFSNLSKLNSQVSDSVNLTSEKINEHSGDQGKILEKFETYISLQKENRENSARLQSEMESTRKEVEKKEQEINDLKQLAMINGALRGVLQAEVFSMYQNSEAAANALLATKGPIYQFGTLHPNYKDKMIGLMGPIDSLAASWKNGDHKKSSISIRNVLKETIKDISL